MKPSHKKAGTAVIVLAALVLIFFLYQFIGSFAREKKARSVQIKQIVELWDAGQYDPLIDRAEQYLAQYPQDSNVRILRGISLLSSAELGAQSAYQRDVQTLWQAVYELRRALVINPGVSYKKEANFVLGKAYYLLGGTQTAKAVPYLEQSIKSKVDAPSAYEFLIAAYKEMGEYTKAEKIIKDILYNGKYASLDRQTAGRFRLALIDMYLDAGNAAAAEEEIAAALKDTAASEQEQAAFLVRRARGLIERGSEQQAIAMLTKIVEKDPRSFEALYYLGNAYDKLQEQGKARYYWREALAINPYWDKILEKLSDAPSEERKG